MVRETSFSRYPLVEQEKARPMGVLHVKDLFLHADGNAPDPERLRKLARPCPTLREDLPLDDALTRFQRAYHHFAIVNDARGEWTGIITIEDVLEELVGKIGDEFDVSPQRADCFAGRCAHARPRASSACRESHWPRPCRTYWRRCRKKNCPAAAQPFSTRCSHREAQMATYLGAWSGRSPLPHRQPHRPGARFLAVRKWHSASMAPMNALELIFLSC